VHSGLAASVRAEENNRLGAGLLPDPPRDLLNFTKSDHNRMIMDNDCYYNDTIYPLWDKKKPRPRTGL